MKFREEAALRIFVANPSMTAREAVDRAQQLADAICGRSLHDPAWDAEDNEFYCERCGAGCNENGTEEPDETRAPCLSDAQSRAARERPVDK